MYKYLEIFGIIALFSFNVGCSMNCDDALGPDHAQCIHMDYPIQLSTAALSVQGGLVTVHMSDPSTSGVNYQTALDLFVYLRQDITGKVLFTSSQDPSFIAGRLPDELQLNFTKEQLQANGFAPGPVKFSIFANGKRITFNLNLIP